VCQGASLRTPLRTPAPSPRPSPPKTGERGSILDDRSPNPPLPVQVPSPTASGGEGQGEGGRSDVEQPAPTNSGLNVERLTLNTSFSILHLPSSIFPGARLYGFGTASSCTYAGCTLGFFFLARCNRLLRISLTGAAARIAIVSSVTDRATTCKRFVSRRSAACCHSRSFPKCREISREIHGDAPHGRDSG
jgi:hypothetical protein